MTREMTVSLVELHLSELKGIMHYQIYAQVFYTVIARLLQYPGLDNFRFWLELGGANRDIASQNDNLGPPNTTSKTLDLTPK